MKNSQSYKVCFTYSALFSVVTLAFMPSFSWANDNFADFDANFLVGLPNVAKIDVSRFNYGNPVVKGEYIADIKLNNQNRGRIAIRFVDVPEQSNAVLCATPDLLAILDLTSSAIHSVDDVQGCQLFPQVVPEAKYQFDMGSLTLDVNIPQAFVIQHPKDYISPARWQTGVPVGFVNYYSTHYSNTLEGNRYDNTYLSLDAGLNIAGWALRHRGSLSWSNGKREPYQSTSTYLQKDIPMIRGQLTIGDFYTSGALMESISMRGMQFASDDRMLAASERGYAPIIRGTANSNALVIVRQSGVVLREVSVPAGPFAISDLYPVGFGGDIEVEVKEANGEIRRFTVPYTATAQLMRPGYSRYMLAVGRYRYANKLYNEKVVQGTWQYGLTNNITFNLGTTLSNDYHSELMGIAFNTPIGSFATNATFSNATFSGNRYLANGKSDTLRGYSLYASYNTRIDPTNTNVTLAAYRYLSRYYYSLQDFIEKNNDYDFIPRQVANLGYSYRPKNQFQVTINQQLKDNWGTFYLTGSSNTYWGSNKKQFDYQFGYSNLYKKLNYSLAFYQIRNAYGDKDHQIYLSLSLPLDDDRYHSVSQNFTQSKLNGLISNTNFYGSLGQQQYTYSLSFYKQSQNKNNSITFNNAYLSPYARLDAGLTKSNDNSKQLSFGLSGAVVAHPKGITLANGLGDTFAIIHAKGAKGAKINGSIGNKVDGFGNGIVPYLSPYSINSVGLDISSIPDTVELSATSQEVIPRANTALLIDFETTTGSIVFFEIQNTDKIPPLGTEVFNQNGENIGVVAQGGRIYTRGVPASGKLQLSWGEQSCRINYRIPNDKQNSTTPVIIPVTCD